MTEEKSFNRGIAGILSFFIPGLGQIYKGQVGRGIFYLLLTCGLYCAPMITMFGGLGALMGSVALALIVHLLVIIGAVTSRLPGYLFTALVIFWIMAGLIVVFVSVAGRMGGPKTAQASTTRTTRDYVYEPVTHCGDVDHDPGVANWSDYKCNNWVVDRLCLSRAKYSSVRGMGCPGRQKCCPN